MSHRARWLVAGLLTCWGAVGLAEEGPVTPCQDPIFLQVEARISEYPTAEERRRGWQEFIHNHPQNACVDEAHRRLADLDRSEKMEGEKESRKEWEQEARGGVIEPNRDEFPAHTVFFDPPANDRIRLVSEVIWLGDEWKSDIGEQIRGVDVVRDAVWTMILRGEFALVSRLGFNVEIPVAAAVLDGDGYRWALGNIALGVRGIWGTRLGDAEYPWVISGGIQWGSGTSVWSGEDRSFVVDAAAVGGAYFRHYFRYDAPDYIGHAESQIGFGSHFLGLGMAYHVYAGGEHVEKIFRFDLAWDWRISDLFEVGIELNGGVGDGEPVVGGTENENLFFVYASPGARLRLGWFSAALAVRIPLADAWGWSRMVTAFEFTATL